MSLGTPWMLLLLPLVPLAGWLMARGRRLQREAACRLKGVAPENGQAVLESYVATSARRARIFPSPFGLRAWPALGPAAIV